MNSSGDDNNNNAGKYPSGQPPVKIALVGDSSLQLLAQAMKRCGDEAGLDPEIIEFSDRIERHILDASSPLYAAAPDFIAVVPAVQRLLDDFYAADERSRPAFAERYLRKVDDLCAAVAARLRACKIIYGNFPEHSDSVFGNYAAKVPSSFACQVRKLNLGLMRVSQQRDNLFINDLCGLCARTGERAVDPRLWVNADMAFSLDFLPQAAKNTLDIIGALRGKIRKCLILDLDNLLWGGNIADEGLEGIQVGALGVGKAFTALQRWIKELKNRGVVLAVCSKNDEAVAREPFEKHPDMVLRLEDFAVFAVNWNNKTDTIRDIGETLGIAQDSLVFLDDDPLERARARERFPALSVPDLPRDPAEYLPFLTGCNLFETAAAADEDRDRTRHYREEMRRRSAARSSAATDDFLSGIGMTAGAHPFDDFSIPRIAQLTQRSNQFNVRTMRYSESDIRRFASSGEFVTRCFTLKDVFGDYGVIAATILQKQGTYLLIDTWVMSCRALTRGMEECILNHLVDLAHHGGFAAITGEYRRTPKNGIVSDLYPRLGFSQKSGCWELPVAEYVPKKTPVRLFSSG